VKLQNVLLTVGLSLSIILVAGCGSSSHSNSTPTASARAHQVFALFPPLTPSDKDYNDFNQYVLTNANVAGVSAALPWNAIESDVTPGSYDFTTYDANLQHIISAGKTINLIVQGISEGKANTLTPAYVFTSSWASTCCSSAPLDVVTCDAYPGNGDADTGMPVFTEPPFETAYKNFISAVIQHYSNNPSIGYIRFGLGLGGEVAPLCVTQWPNFSKTDFLNFVQNMMSFEASLHGQVRLEQNIHAIGNPPDVSYADAEASYAVQDGFIGFGNNGANVQDVSAASSGQPCNADWCALFDKYAGTEVDGSPIVLQLQTLGPTDPTNAGEVGSLSQILPFAAQHHANTFELFVPDLLLAFDPHYASSSPATAAFAVYASSYAQAIQTFVSGK